jgi:hypothetical protein
MVRINKIFRDEHRLRKLTAQTGQMRSAAAMLTVILGMPAAARAEGITPIAGPHGDTLASLLVVLCVALSLILLCRPSGRYVESKLEKFEEE